MQFVQLALATLIVMAHAVYPACKRLRLPCYSAQAAELDHDGGNHGDEYTATKIKHDMCLQ